MVLGRRPASRRPLHRLLADATQDGGHGPRYMKTSGTETGRYIATSRKGTGRHVQTADAGRIWWRIAAVTLACASGSDWNGGRSLTVAALFRRYAGSVGASPSVGGTPGAR
jgi:hypothetical protein